MTKLFYYSANAAMDRIKIAEGSFVRVEELGNDLESAMDLASPREDETFLNAVKEQT